MENKFIYQLGKKLIFHASYLEMHEILEDYTQFSEVGPIAEEPKDVIRSLYEAGHRAMMVYTILGLLCVSNVWLFVYIDLHRQLPFLIQFAIPFALSILLPFLVYIVMGKKIMLLSGLCTGVKNSKIIVYISNVFSCLAVGVIFYGAKTLNSFKLRFIETAFGTAAIVGIILFGYFMFTRGVSYYFGLCSCYILLCTIYQIKAVQSQMSDFKVYIRDINIALLCYFAAILLSFVWLMIIRNNSAGRCVYPTECKKMMKK